MFGNSMTDEMMLQAAIKDCREVGLEVTIYQLSAAMAVVILVKEANGFPLTAGKFELFNATGAVQFLINTYNDYRSWN